LVLSIISLVGFEFEFVVSEIILPLLSGVRSPRSLWVFADYGKLLRGLVVFIVLHWSLEIYAVACEVSSDCLGSGARDSWSSSLISLGLLSFGFVLLDFLACCGDFVYGPFSWLDIECGFGAVMCYEWSRSSRRLWQRGFRVGSQNAKYIGQDAITLCMALFR
jgi:hypothetical protein